MSVPEQYGKVPEENVPTSAPTDGWRLPSGCPYVMASTVSAAAHKSAAARVIFLSLNIEVSFKASYGLCGMRLKRKSLLVGEMSNRHALPADLSSVSSREDRTLARARASPATFAGCCRAPSSSRRDEIEVYPGTTSFEGGSIAGMPLCCQQRPGPRTRRLQ